MQFIANEQNFVAANGYSFVSKNEAGRWFALIHSGGNLV